jgi:hypothetical protein
MISQHQVKQNSLNQKTKTISYELKKKKEEIETMLTSMKFKEINSVQKATLGKKRMRPNAEEIVRSSNSANAMLKTAMLQKEEIEVKQIK